MRLVLHVGAASGGCKWFCYKLSHVHEGFYTEKLSVRFFFSFMDT